jgi:AcrR family transcriptional regulator
VLKRKDKILISAIELLDEGGINNVTTKKIAELQGVSEPALYRQYKGKLDIIKNMIEEFASYDQKIMNTIIESKMRGKEAVLFYVKRFAELYQNYSELTTIVYSMDVYQYDEQTKKMMYDITFKKIDFLEKIISESKSEGKMNTCFEAKEIASMINGLIFSLVYEWRLEGKTYCLEAKLLTIVEKLL